MLGMQLFQTQRYAAQVTVLLDAWGQRKTSSWGCAIILENDSQASTHPNTPFTGTTVASWYLAGFLSRFDWFVCPRTVRGEQIMDRLASAH